MFYLIIYILQTENSCLYIKICYL